MSFGFGVGDFLAAIELAGKLKSRWDDAPAEYEAISNETKNLESILQEIEDLEPEVDISAQQRDRLRNASSTCVQVLKQLEKIVNKYSAVQKESIKGHNRLRRVWTRFKLDPDDIRHLRDQVISTVAVLTSLQISISNNLTSDVKEDVETLAQSDQEREKEAVANWFAPASFGEQQNDYLAQRQAETGTWFLNDPRYVNWKETSGSTLLCPGIPGSGKTVMAATVIDDLRKSFNGSDNVVVAYFYCNFRRQFEQSLEQMLASLVRQVFQEQKQLPAAVKELYQKHRDRQTRPSADELKSLLRFLTGGYYRVFLIIDALDECANVGGSRDKFLHELFALQDQNRKVVNLLATSRFIPEILDPFSSFPRIEVRARSEDIERYLEARMPELCAGVLRNRSLQQEIKREIARLVEGMFLLTRLHFDSLQDKTTPRDIRDALTKLPRGIDGLSKAYDDARKRIDNQREGFRRLAHQVLSWITYARSELTIDELVEAVAIQPSMACLDPDEDFTSSNDLISYCAGLVVIDPDSQTVRLVHYTLQEYLEQVRDQWLPQGDIMITEKCLAYLSMEDFGCGWCETDGGSEQSETEEGNGGENGQEEDLQADDGDGREDEERESEPRIDEIAEVNVEKRRKPSRFKFLLSKYKFLKHAAENWGHYAAKIEDENTQGQILRFLEQDNHLQFANQVRMAEFYGDRHYFYDGRNISPLHLCACFNISYIAIKLLGQGAASNHRDSDGSTPLIWAAEYGSEDVAKTLLGCVDIDVNKEDEDGETALYMAASRGHAKVVQLLLARPEINVNKEDKYGQTALFRAAGEGHAQIVQLLLARPEINVNKEDKYGRTALFRAAGGGHAQVVQLLLARPDIDVNKEDEDGETALHRAAERGHAEVVQLLLARPDIDVNKGGKYGQTALHRAAERGHADVVQLLLARPDIDVNKEDTYSRIALYEAARGGHAQVVQLLLARPDIDVNKEDKYGGTALYEAASNGYVEVLQLLLARLDIDVNKGDQYGQTALYRAASNGHVEVVQLLLARLDIDVNKGGQYGQTALYEAASNGHIEVVQLLLARPDIDVNKGDKYGWTALYMAARTGYAEVVQLLLARPDIDVNKGDKYGQTALYMAVWKGHAEVVQLLLARLDIDVNKGDKDSRTALYGAAWNGYAEVVQLLLARSDIDVNKGDKYGRTALYMAAWDGRAEVVQLLLARPDIDVNKGDKDGWTALYVAARGGHAQVVQLLLARPDIDVNLVTRWGSTALDLVIEKHYEEIVKMLREGGGLTAKELWEKDQVGTLARFKELNLSDDSLDKVIKKFE